MTKIKVGLSLTLLLVGFQNCSSFDAKGFGTTLSSLCSQDSATAIPVYEATFHNFFVTNSCSTCHSESGLKSDSPFAGSDLAVAFTAFSRLGAATIEAKLAGGHQGYSYENLAADFTAAQTEFAANSTSQGCAGEVEGATKGKTLPFFAEEMIQDVSGVNYYPLLADLLGSFLELEFDLAADLDPTLAGVKLKMEVSVRYSNAVEAPRRPTGYLVQNIQLKSLDKKLVIKGINVLLNGNSHDVSTFTNVEATVLPGDYWQTVSGLSTASLYVDNFANTDEWQVQILSLQEM